MKNFFIIVGLLLCAILPTYAGLYDDIIPSETSKPQTKENVQTATNQKQITSKLTELEIQMLGQEIIMRKLDDIENDLQIIKERLGIY